MQFLNNVIVLPPLKIPIRHILSCTSYFFKDGESEAKNVILSRHTTVLLIPIVKYMA